MSHEPKRKSEKQSIKVKQSLFFFLSLDLSKECYLKQIYGLNACDPQNVSVEILASKVMALGGEAYVS